MATEKKTNGVNMEQPTTEQLQKFWEWCGFTPHKIDDELWRYETFKETNFWWNSPDARRWRSLPTLDLNSLFKYAVPKLSYCFLSGVWISDEQVMKYGCAIGMPDGESKDELRYTEHTLALFWAIWEVIK